MEERRVLARGRVERVGQDGIGEKEKEGGNRKGEVEVSVLFAWRGQ